MRRLALLLVLFVVAACAGAQVNPIAQPIKVDRLPACNVAKKHLAYQVKEAGAGPLCTPGGTADSICVCDGTQWLIMAGGLIGDHGGLAGLADDDHAQYPLLAGRGTGQTLHGGPAAGGDLNLFANDFDGPTLGLSLESTDDVSDSYIATLAAGANYSPSFRAESDASGLATPYADVNSGGAGDTRFTHGSGRTLIGNMNFAGVQIFGWEGIFGLGIDSTSDATMSCLDVDTDRLYGDLDCDSTKDVGEEYLDHPDSGALYLPLSSSTSQTVEVTGAGNDFTLDIADAFDMTIAGVSTWDFADTLLVNTSADIQIDDPASAGVEFYLTNGSITIGALLVQPSNAETCADDGAGTAATLTITPLYRGAQIVNQDPHGCVITMSEAGMANGVYFTAVVTQTAGGNVTFSDTAGVTEIAGAFNMGLWDSITLYYTSTTWVEVGRSNN